jgi:hypothetical protein
MVHVHQDRKELELIQGADRIGSCLWQNLQVAGDLIGIIGNMVLVNSGFHAPKNFSEINPKLRKEAP